MVGKGKKIREKKWLDDEEKFVRLICLLKLEIERIMFDVDFRKDVLFKLWSKERTREPLLKTLHSRFFDLDFHSLILLPKSLFKKIDSFYKTLDDLTFYVTYTEDMPHTMKSTFDMFLKELKHKFEVLDKEISLYYTEE
ncbi:MAG: hypothetical protein WCQ47_02315 [bacterium]